MIKDKEYYKGMFGAFFVSFIPKFIVAIQMIPYAVFDEGPSLAMPAYLAGKDWSTILEGSAYYGIGYYTLFTPIFLLTDNPYIIYRTVAVGNAFVQALISIVVFKILYDIFDLKDYKYNAIVSVLCSYLIVVRVSAYNETGLVFCNWLIALVLCKLLKCNGNKSKKNQLTIVLIVILTYTLTIHTRAIILFIVIFGVGILYMLFKKEDLYSRVFYVASIFMIFSSEMFIKLIQKIMWNAGNKTVANTSLNIEGALNQIDIFSLATWKSIFLTILGQVNTIMIFTGGLFIVAVILSCVYFYRIAVKKENATSDDKCLFFLSLIFGGTALLMVGAQSISWLYSIKPYVLTPVEEIIHKDIYGYKAFTYIRYMGAYIGPLILASLVIIKKNPTLLYKMGFKIAAISFGINVLWIKYVLPYVKSNGSCFETYAPWALREPYEQIDINSYLAASAWLHIITFVFLAFVYKKQIKIYLYVLIISLIFQFCFMGLTNDVIYGRDRSRVAATYYDFAKRNNLDTMGNKEVYADVADQFRLQFYLNNYQIILGMPNEENAILFFEGNLDELEGINLQEYKYIVLEKNTFVLLKGDLYLNKIINEEYQILSF